MGNIKQLTKGVPSEDITTRYGPVWWYDGYMTNKTSQKWYKDVQRRDRHYKYRNSQWMLTHQTYPLVN